MYELKRKVIYGVLLMTVVTVAKVIRSLLYDAPDFAHSLILLYCMSFFTTIHIDDYSSSRLILFRDVPLLIYLASTFAYHYAYFVLGSVHEFVMEYSVDLSQTHFGTKPFVALRYIFAGISIIPILYSIAFAVRRLSDSSTIVSFLIYVLSTYVDNIIQDTEYGEILLEYSFPFMYFKLRTETVEERDIDIVEWIAPLIQIALGIVFSLLVWYLWHRQTKSHQLPLRQVKGEED